MVTLRGERKCGQEHVLLSNSSNTAECTGGRNVTELDMQACMRRLASVSRVGVNPSRGIDQDLIRHVVVVIWGCRIAPTGCLNVKGWMYWLLKVNMNSQYLYGSSYLASYDTISFCNNG